MDIDFECTQCGKCCHDLKLPLTVKEAIAWLSDGHEVQVICEAVPWEIEPASTDLKLAHKRRRSFGARSGLLEIRVDVILAASFVGACPNLRADMRCGNYERRPLVCRIYPAEISPFIRLQSAEKACPPEAWSTERPPLIRGGALIDADLQMMIQESRDSDRRDVRTKELVCAAMGLDSAALMGEGFVIYSPGRAELLDALTQYQGSHDRSAEDTAWRCISNQRATTIDLAARGSVSALAVSEAMDRFEYLGFRAVSA